MNRPATVIVVNDEPTQLHLSSALLERDGLNVQSCQAAEEALRLLDAGCACDLIVTDLAMPGIDGWRFCRLLRSPEYADFNRTPVLVVSATFSGAEPEQLTADLGADLFLPFPYKADVFVKCVHDLLDGRVPRASQHVLLMRQDLSELDAVRKAFEDEGYQVHAARTGRDAQALLEKHSHEIVVLDARLPDMATADFLQRVKRSGSPSVAITIVKDSDRREIVDLIRQGADGYLQEPFSPERLLRLCESTRRERSLLRIEELLEERTEGLRKSEARFRSLFEAISEAVIVHDAGGRILHVNKAGARCLEWSLEDLVGRNLHDVLSGEAPSLQRWGKSRSGSNAGRFDARLLTKTGKVLEAEVSQCPIEFEERSALLSVARDVTERRSMERELLEARKLEGLGTLAGGIAHEFNNILTGIMGYAELLSDGIEPSAVTRPYVDKIADLSHRAASLVSELLTFSNRMPSERHPVHLLPLVGEAVRTLRRTLPETIDIQWKASDRVATVKADISQVQQLIMNLASNARDAMPRGGSLVVALEDVALDAAASRLHLNARPGRYVRLSVRDTGTGMTPEVREQIFDPFFTTKDIGKGPGLGLATVHGIVKAHDGFISVSTELGKGSEFDVYLPAMEPAEGPQEVVSQAPHREGKTILLVEDDLAVLDVGREMLKSLGYNVLTARDGEEGLNTYRASGNEIDLVITDMEMPKMTGMDLCKALWRIDPQLKVILASAHNVREREAQLLTTGVRGFLQKPFGMRNLETTIRQALDIGALAGLEGQMVSGTAC